MAITAKDVKELRDRTDAPMMECKSALEASGGDMEKAIKILRERGVAKMAKRADRETTEGAIKMMIGQGNKGGTAVVVTCETDFSARNEAFQGLVQAALEAAHASGVEDPKPEQVLESKAGGATLKAKLEDVANTIRENMSLKTVVRWNGVCGAYVHHDGRKGALVEVEGGDGSPATATLLRELCMHIVSIAPPPLAVEASGIPQEVIDQEKEIFIKQAMDTGKSKEIAEKMVAGRMKKFYAERALLEQPFVKNPDQTVAAYLAAGTKSAGVPAVKVKRFVRLQIGE